jgi:hypothetical protein
VLSDGRYDGNRAAQEVAEWNEGLKIAFPQEDHYDLALSAIKKKRRVRVCVCE